MSAVIDENLCSPRELGDRVLTCPACNRTMTTLERGLLPFHHVTILREGRDAEESRCVGSYTIGANHRFLPEIKPLYMEIVEDDVPATSRNFTAIYQCAKFLCDWLGKGMQTDNVQLTKIAKHAHAARGAALNMIR